jgi:hypothetical protein
MPRTLTLLVLLVSSLSQLAIAAPVNWTPLSGYTPRFGHAAISHGGYLWVIGGYKVNGGCLNDVWRSQDGTKWECVTTSASFSPRWRQQAVSFQGRIWIIGGLGANYETKMDQMWSSPDGEHWERGPRSIFENRLACAVFKNQLYAVANGTQVWRCDGTTWTQVTVIAGLGPRSDYSCEVFDGKLWLLGGNLQGVTQAEVSYTSDGLHWTNVQQKLPFVSTRGLQTFVNEQRLWVLTGTMLPMLTAKGNWGNIWSSADGVNWRQELIHWPEATVSDFRLTTHAGKFWITGGVTVRRDQMGWLADTLSNWVSTNGTEWSRVAPQRYLPVRTDAANCLHDDALWQIGGTDGFVDYNDVYRTTDGQDWQIIKGNPPFAPRSRGAAVSYHGSLLLAGGEASAPQGGTRIPNRDIWKTTDGLSWDLVTTGTPFTVEGPGNLQVLGNKLWAIETNGAQRAWSSDDGVSWTLQADALPFGRRQMPALTLWHNKLWLSGGLNTSNQVLDDLWTTTDGQHWQAQPISGARLARYHHTLAATPDRLLLLNGDAKLSDEISNVNAWTEDGIQWTSSTAPYYQREGHAACYYHDRLYLWGGSAFEPNDGGYASHYFSTPFDDTWASDDQGLHWRMQTRYPAPKGRFDPLLLTAQGKLNLLGGYAGYFFGAFGTVKVYLNDLWTSPDGNRWEMVYAKALAFNTPVVAATVYQDRLYYLACHSYFREVRLMTTSGSLATELSARDFDYNSKLIAFKDKLHVLSLLSATCIADATTTDGTQWEVTTGTVPTMSAVGDLYVVNDTLWMATGNTATPLAKSANGTEWNFIAPPANQTLSNFTVAQNLLFGAAHNAVDGASQYDQIVSSPDGVTWTTQFAITRDLLPLKLQSWQDQLLLIESKTSRFALWIAEPAERSGTMGWALYQ